MNKYRTVQLADWQVRIILHVVGQAIIGPLCLAGKHNELALDSGLLDLVQDVTAYMERRMPDFGFSIVKACDCDEN